MSLLKNIYLNVELKENTVDDPGYWSYILAKEISIKFPEVKSVQYRYGAFGRVDKVYSE